MRAERTGPAPAEARLWRALAASARTHGVAATLAEHRSHPWASATFTGTRHALTLAAPRAPGLGGWLDALPEAELLMPGHVVASLAVEHTADTNGTVHIALAVLTIAEH